MRAPSLHRQPPAILITDAERSRYEDHRERVRRYLFSMAVRTLCFVLAVWLLHGVARVVAIAGSLVLPWVAVALANAGPRSTAEQPGGYVAQPPPALHAGTPTEHRH